jgi:hypothetical protein
MRKNEVLEPPLLLLALIDERRRQEGHGGAASQGLHERVHLFLRSRRLTTVAIVVGTTTVPKVVVEGR